MIGLGTGAEFYGPIAPAALTSPRASPEDARRVADLIAKHRALIAPFLWEGELPTCVVEVTTDPGTARRTGVLAVTPQRVLVLVEMRAGGGLKTTLRTYSFRVRTLKDVKPEGANVRLETPEHAVAVRVTDRDDEPGTAAALRVVRAILESRTGAG